MNLNIIYMIVITTASLIISYGGVATTLYKGNKFFNEKFSEKVNEVVRPQLKALEEKTDKQFKDFTEKNSIEHTMIFTGLIAVLMDRIKQFAEFLIKRRFATMYDKQTIQSLFAAYKSFGGNSFIPELIDEVMALPLTKPKIKRKTRKAEKEDV